MSQSGVNPLISVRAVTRLLLPVSAPAEISRAGISVRGPLLTLATAVLFDALLRHGFVVGAPFPLLVVTVVYAALTGGFGPAIVSAVITTVYAVHFYSERVAQLRYDMVGVSSLAAASGAAWIAALLVSRYRSGVSSTPGGVELTRAEADAIGRRLSLLEQASAILASSPDYEITLSRVARLLVPARADWCTMHLATGQGGLRFVAGAHRDPSRDLLVRALAEYGGRGLPFGAPEEAADVIAVHDPDLRRRAEDAEHLKLYRALGPVAALRVPIPARGEVAGVLTLVIADSARDVTPDDVDLAEELADRLSLAIQNAVLQRDAAEAERRFQLLFTANPQPMWAFDVESLAFLAVNEAAIRHYGYSREEFKAMSIMDLVPAEPPSTPVPLDRFDARIGVALAQHRRKDGTVLEMELISHELELGGRRARLVMATDVSERTRALASLHQSEEQLREAQRMEAVGRIGIGVAHDFNNILTSIHGFGDMLLRDLSASDPARSNVERIQQAADRGALLTRQLLAFGRRQPLQPRPVDLNGVVLGMEELIRRLAGEDIEVRTRFAKGLGTVNIDPARLEQALVSLILTARDAMPSGGTMTIETTERHMAGHPSGRHLPAGHYAVLAISDTGGGPDSEAGKRPRDRRVGEGLGLQVVNSIVRQSGGLVRVTGEPGEGRTVKIYLPLADLATIDEPALRVAPRGSETVLVVEDEDAIRELIGRMLTDAGYQVLTARDGREALEISERHGAAVDLLVTDVVMPGMSGGELAQALSGPRPGLQVLYISGYTDSDVLHRGVRRLKDTFLDKPFTGEELLRKVRSLLDHYLM